MPNVNMRTVARILAAVGMVVAAVAGFEMVSLESQAGNTVAEAFYNQMGLVGIGLALLLLAVFLAAERRVEHKPESAKPFAGGPAACPDCRQIISEQASTCPFCHARLSVSSAAPNTRED